MNWIEVAKAIDNLKRYMVTSQLIEWLEYGREIVEREEDEE